LLLYEAHTPGIKTELRTMEILRAETNEFPHLKATDGGTTNNNNNNNNNSSTSS
ncbi:unnamed protein product, partial [Rotaria sordida]